LIAQLDKPRHHGVKILLSNLRRWIQVDALGMPAVGTLQTRRANVEYKIRAALLAGKRPASGFFDQERFLAGAWA
jgi:hypothetical protein